MKKFAHLVAVAALAGGSLAPLNAGASVAPRAAGQDPAQYLAAIDPVLLAKANAGTSDLPWPDEAQLVIEAGRAQAEIANGANVADRAKAALARAQAAVFHAQGEVDKAKAVELKAKGELGERKEIQREQESLIRLLEVGGAGLMAAGIAAGAVGVARSAKKAKGPKA